MLETSQWIALSGVGVAAAGIVLGPWLSRQGQGQGQGQRLEREQRQRDEWSSKASPGVQAAKSLIASRTPTAVELQAMDGALADEELAAVMATDNARWCLARDAIGEVEAGHPSPAVRVRCHELKLAISRYLSQVHAVLATGTVGEEHRNEELSRAAFNAADDLVAALHE